MDVARRRTIQGINRQLGNLCRKVQRNRQRGEKCSQKRKIKDGVQRKTLIKAPIITVLRARSIRKVATRGDQKEERSLIVPKTTRAVNSFIEGKANGGIDEANTGVDKANRGVDKKNTGVDKAKAN